MREVIIFFKQQCHLCHVALRIARHIQMDTSFTLHAIDISEDVSLLAQYGTRIPVILIDQGGLALGASIFAGLLSELQLREMSAVGGLLIIGVGLKLLSIRDVKVADYLPAILVAPLLVAAVVRIKEALAL